MSEEIIDGVNVAECRFLDEWKHCDICEKLCDSKCLIVEDIECKTYDGCYYKQLKRLQAENEELKKQLEFSRTHKAVLDAERIKYKKALEEIREIAKEIDDVDKWIEQDLMPTQVCERVKEITDRINEVLK